MWSKVLERLKTDFHIPIALLIFAVTSAYHFHTGHDLGSQYTNSLYALYAFLGGHAWARQKYGDSDDSSSGTNPDGSK